MCYCEDYLAKLKHQPNLEDWKKLNDMWLKEPEELIGGPTGSWSEHRSAGVWFDLTAA